MEGNIAFLFPGQGSQVVGMGKDLFEAFSTVRELFEKTDDICGRKISQLCFEGPMEELTTTSNLQPAVATVSLACLSVLRDSGRSADLCAGHSLGEYAALAGAEVLSDEDALKLVSRRGQLMQREAEANPGAMVAVLGLGIQDVEQIVAEASEVGAIAVANHNTAEQIVITGTKQAMAKASALVKDRKGKAIPLKVSGAWHSPLMQGAVEEFRDYMESIEFSPPKSRVLFNATAQEEDNPDVIKELMARQLVSPVRWYDIMINMISNGVRHFVEVGPKTVLIGLAKKIVPKDTDIQCWPAGNLKTIEAFLKAVG